VAGNVVPLDSIGVEVVQDSEADLRMGRVLSGSTVVRLGQVRSSCVRPVGALAEADWLCVPVVPRHNLVRVVHLAACPEIPLSILSDQPVEVVLLGGSVQGHRLHAHRLAVRLGLVLLERGAANLPGGHIAALDVVPGVGPEMVRCCCSTEAGASH